MESKTQCFLQELRCCPGHRASKQQILRRCYNVLDAADLSTIVQKLEATGVIAVDRTKSVAVYALLMEHS